VKRRPRFKPDAFQVLRKRLLHETEVALHYGMSFPDRHPRIPIMEVGKGAWNPEFAVQFWQDALDLEELETTTLEDRMEA
jgi:hypothetical protein